LLFCCLADYGLEANFGVICGMQAIYESERVNYAELYLNVFNCIAQLFYAVHTKYHQYEHLCIIQYNSYVKVRSNKRNVWLSVFTQELIMCINIEQIVDKYSQFSH
jgi:hypothetical protein